MTTNVGGNTCKAAASLIRPASATTYTIGDIIANSGTAASVTPIEFIVARSGCANKSGRITGAQCTVVAASGTVVLPTFDLVLFNPDTDVPFAAGGYPADNAPINMNSNSMKNILGVFNFANWYNYIGGTTAVDGALYSAATLKDGRAFCTFELANVPQTPQFNRLKILGLLIAQSAWNPGAVVNTFNFSLDVDQD